MPDTSWSSRRVLTILSLAVVLGGFASGFLRFLGGRVLAPSDEVHAVAVRVDSLAVRVDSMRVRRRVKDSTQDVRLDRLESVARMNTYQQCVTIRSKSLGQADALDVCREQMNP